MQVDMSARCPAQSPHVGDGAVPSQIREDRGGRAWPHKRTSTGHTKGRSTEDNKGRRASEMFCVSFQQETWEVGSGAGAASAPSKASPSSQASWQSDPPPTPAC